MLGYDRVMVNKPSTQTIPFDSPATYQISVQGRIDPGWSDCLEGMSISLITSDLKAPVTTLVGELTDQAALAGVFNTLYELHLPVLSIKCLSVY